MKQVFKDNPRLDVCYETADGKHFFLENDARNYASNLENKMIKKLVRDVSAPEEIVVPIKLVTEATKATAEPATNTNTVVEEKESKKVDATKKTPKTKK